MTETNQPAKAHFKNWKNYFFEFIMLFLAVTLGFFVDNFRENISEEQQELQHVQSLIADVTQDTFLFKSQVRDLRLVISSCDSLILLIKQKDRSNHDCRRLYFLTRRIAPKVTSLFMNDRTFEEMRSSGTLRLIRLRNVSDSISNYYFKAKQLSYLNNIAIPRVQRKMELESKIFDATIYSMMVGKEKFSITAPSGVALLMTENPGIINEFAVTIHYIGSWAVYSKNYIESLNVNADRLLSVLKKEYNQK